MATDKTEQYELSRVDAIPCHNSGRGKFQKADGIIHPDETSQDWPNGFITVDVKESDTMFGVSLKAWAKLNTDGKANRTPYSMFFVSLGKEEPKERMAVISERHFKELMEVYLEHYNG